jgi:hypothetical protein
MGQARSARDRRRITAKLPAITVAVVALTAACSQILGFKDPTLEELGAPAIDASSTSPSDVSSAPAIDASSAPPIDASRPPIDASSVPTDAPIDGAAAACVPSACPFGCDPDSNACRNGKLWIFKTEGAFFGNAFGGTDVPVNVRGGADGKCLATYAAMYGGRQCNNARVHAVLHVNGTDSLALMATTYGIPTNVPVNRADDDVLVSNNWNELTDPSKMPHAAATTATTDADGIVWTGTNTVATCKSWTSGSSADSGMRGYTNRVEVTWLGQDTFRCDRLAALLCICWSGGE